ncbi:MAG TPA: hypothetical protein VGD33_11645 [Chitinophagaceae bacterium]
MNIEFHLPHGKVSERIVGDMRRELLKLYHDDRDISRAQVYFKEFGKMNVVQQCIIDLTIYGNRIKIRREANSFQLAAKKALADIKERVELLIEKKDALPEELTTTVNV